MNKIVIFRQQFLFFSLSIIVKILYEVLVILCLPKYYTIGVPYGLNINLSKLILGWIIYIIFLILLIHFFAENFICYSLFFFFYMSFLPISSYFGLGNVEGIYILYQVLYWLCIFLCYIYFRNKKYNMKLSIKYRNGSFLFFVSILFVFFIVLLFTYKFNHLSISFNLADVYDVRASASGKLPIYMAWIKQSFGGIVIPFLIVFLIEKKKYFFIFILSMTDILLFSIAMDKSYLFKLFIAYMIGFVIPKLKKNQPTILVLVVLILGFCLALLEKLWKNSTFIFFVIIRRMFYIPAWINTMYFDFFQNNHKLFLSQSVFLLSKLFPSIYNQNYLTIINENYFNGAVPSPNNGLFAEAFSQIGISGLFIFPIILIFFLFFFAAIIDNYSISCKIIGAYCLTGILVNIFMLSGYFVSIYIPFILFIIFINPINSIKNDNLMKKISVYLKPA